MNGPSRNDPNHNQLIREIKWGETAKNEKNQNSVKPVVLPISKKMQENDSLGRKTFLSWETIFIFFPHWPFPSDNRKRLQSFIPVRAPLPLPLVRLWFKQSGKLSIVGWGDGGRVKRRTNIGPPPMTVIIPTEGIEPNRKGGEWALQLNDQTQISNQSLNEKGKMQTTESKRRKSKWKTQRKKETDEGNFGVPFLAFPLNHLLTEPDGTSQDHQWLDTSLIYSFLLDCVSMKMFKKKNKRKWNYFFKKKIEQKRTKWGDSSIYASIYRRGGPRVKKNQSSKRVRDEEKSSARLFREQRLLSFRVELGEEEDCGCSETTVLCLWLDVYNLDFGCYFKERDTCSGRPAEMASNEWNDPQASKRGLVFRERDMRQIDRCVRITYIYIISVV